jgi:hypothetical protein
MPRNARQIASNWTTARRLSVFGRTTSRRLSEPSRPDTRRLAPSVLPAPWRSSQSVQADPWRLSVSDPPSTERRSVLSYSHGSNTHPSDTRRFPGTTPLPTTRFLRSPCDLTPRSTEPTRSPGGKPRLIPSWRSIASTQITAVFLTFPTQTPAVIPVWSFHGGMLHQSQFGLGGVPSRPIPMAVIPVLACHGGMLCPLQRSPGGDPNRSTPVRGGYPTLAIHAAANRHGPCHGGVPHPSTAAAVIQIWPILGGCSCLARLMAVYLAEPVYGGCPNPTITVSRWLIKSYSASPWRSLDPALAGASRYAPPLHNSLGRLIRSALYQSRRFILSRRPQAVTLAAPDLSGVLVPVWPTRGGMLTLALPHPGGMLFLSASRRFATPTHVITGRLSHTVSALAVSPNGPNQAFQEHAPENLR